MARKRKPTSDAVEILHRRYYEGKPERMAGLREARISDSVARQLHELRKQAGVSQRELAERVGTSASAICRLENAEYEGHTLTTLDRIAKALRHKVSVTFRPA